MRLELRGPTPLARLLRSPEQLLELADQLSERCGTLELQLRANGVRVPTDRDELRHAPTLLAEALALIERVSRDAALLESLAPAQLARDCAPGAERSAYLQELLAAHPGRALLRFLIAEDA